MYNPQTNRYIHIYLQPTDKLINKYICTIHRQTKRYMYTTDRHRMTDSKANIIV